MESSDRNGASVHRTWTLYAVLLWVSLQGQKKEGVSRFPISAIAERMDAVDRAGILFFRRMKSLQPARQLILGVRLGEGQHMAGKRSFSDDNIPVKADDYHGLAGYVRTQPDIASQGVKSVNIELTFEEALRLSLAIQSCLLQLNRYKRSATEGREMGMLLSIKTDSNTITVIEKRVRPDEE